MLADVFDLIGTFVLVPFEIAIYRLLISGEAASGYRFDISTVRFQRMLGWAAGFWLLVNIPISPAGRHRIIGWRGSHHQHRPVCAGHLCHAATDDFPARHRRRRAGRFGPKRFRRYRRPRLAYRQGVLHYCAALHPDRHFDCRARMAWRRARHPFRQWVFGSRRIFRSAGISDLDMLRNRLGPAFHEDRRPREEQRAYGERMSWQQQRRDISELAAVGRAGTVGWAEPPTSCSTDRDLAWLSGTWSDSFSCVKRLIRLEFYLLSFIVSTHRQTGPDSLDATPMIPLERHGSQREAYLNRDPGREILSLVVIDMRSPTPNYLATGWWCCLRRNPSPYRFDCGWSLIRCEAMSLCMAAEHAVGRWRWRRL